MDKLFDTYHHQGIHEYFYNLQGILKLFSAIIRTMLFLEINDVSLQKFSSHSSLLSYCFII